MAEPTADEQGGLPPDVVAHYKSMLRGNPAAGLEGLEGVAHEPDLSAGGIAERLGATKAQLHQIVKDYLGDDPHLIEIADRIVDSADRALNVLNEGDEVALRSSDDMIFALKTIVRTDGSRPSFMIRNGQVDRATSPVGTWESTLDATTNVLDQAISCVGRIDVPGTSQGFAGTGWLVQENLIITNRHVLQVAATQQGNGTWTFKPGAAIDFGHEFRGTETLNRRALRRVVFAGSQHISSPIDHTRLDLALIEIEQAPANAAPRSFLAVDVAQDWAASGQQVYIVGYPADPGIGAFDPSLLELLFKTTYGCKRLAPGLVMDSLANIHTWTTAHDATTLGGNSGSVVLVVSRAFAAAGLHYGSRTADPRENWGHVLGKVFDQTDGQSDKTLKEHLDEFGVRFEDRL